MLKVGDVVNVLRASRLPHVEEVIGSGRIEKARLSHEQPVYFIEGFLVGRTERELRKVEGGR